MNNPGNRSRYGLIAAVVAAVTGIAVVARVLFQRRKIQLDQPTIEDSTWSPQPTLPIVIEEVGPESRSWPVVALLPLAGLGCFTLAQTLLLESRNPVQPLLLYVAGIAALLPFLNRPAPQPDLNDAVGLPRGIVLPVVGILTLVGAYIHVQLPSPTIPLIEHTEPMFAFLPLLDFAVQQNISTALVVLMIPAVYVFGRLLDGTLTGIIAAGFAAVSLWTLALGKSGQDYAGLALCSALYLAALYYARVQPRGYLLAAFIFAAGWSLSPYFLVFAYLLALQLNFSVLDARRTGRRLFSGQQAVYKAVRPLLAALGVIGLVGILALFSLPKLNPAPIPEDFKDQVGFSQTIAYIDALSSSLLLFNLSSDPNPLHGVVDRPAFAPVISAAFVVGFLAWAWRLNRSKNWQDWLLPVALMIGVLPSALYITIPLQYPHLGLAASALPVGLVFAAYGLRLIAGQLMDLWGRRGLLMAAGLFLAALYLSAQDARQHYLDVFLPTYERAASLHNQPGTPP